MITLEIEKFGEFNKDDVFRLSITGDELDVLTNDHLRSYKNLKSLFIENNKNLTSIDLRGNTSLQYLCLGTCDHLADINLDQTNISKIDLYDLVALESIELDTKQLLELNDLLSDNITKQFLYIEDAILACMERKIAEANDEILKTALIQAYDVYLD